jgi:hypothetical protein
VSDPVSITVPWYFGTSGASEVDLMRAMQFIVTVYKADSLRHGEETTEEVRRAVNWLHAKYGGAE